MSNDEPTSAKEQLLDILAKSVVLALPVLINWSLRKLLDRKPKTGVPGLELSHPEKAEKEVVP